MRRPLLVSSSIFLATALALPLPAQDASGTITGAYNADDAVWTVAPGGGDDLPASGWIDREDGLAVTLVGSPGPGGPAQDGTLVMRFNLTGQPQELRVIEPTVRMVTIGAEAPLMAGPENIDLMVTALERSADEIAIAGDIVATLTPGGTGDLTIDNDEAILIDGNFQATLARLDSADN